MGSLVPGWDQAAPGMPPVLFRDYKDEEEVPPHHLYKQASWRASQATSAGGAPPALSRTVSAAPVLSRRSVPLAGRHATGTHRPPTQLDAHSPGRRVHSSSTHEASIPEGRAAGLHVLPKWWHRLSSSRLNEMAGQEAAAVAAAAEAAVEEPAHARRSLTFPTGFVKQPSIADMWRSGDGAADADVVLKLIVAAEATAPKDPHTGQAANGGQGEAATAPDVHVVVDIAA